MCTENKFKISMMSRMKMLRTAHKTGEVLRSFCATLEYSPTILAHKNSPDNVTYELAQLVKPQSGKAGSKKAVFVIIDRGMDIRAVLMHDLCLQARCGIYLQKGNLVVQQDFTLGIRH